MKHFCVRAFLLCGVIGALLVGCTNSHPHRDPVGEKFPSVQGLALNDKMVKIPEDMAGSPVLLFVAFDQKSQFDVDRWLVAMSMRTIDVPVYEIPTIPGLLPSMFSGAIDSGMRKGIPEENWGGVVTVYSDGEKLARFTGNETRMPSRVVLLNAEGEVVFFHDEGFSVSHLERLEKTLAGLSSTSREKFSIR